MRKICKMQNISSKIFVLFLIQSNEKQTKEIPRFSADDGSIQNNGMKKYSIVECEWYIKTRTFVLYKQDLFSPLNILVNTSSDTS